MSNGQQTGIDGDQWAQLAQLAQANGWLWNQALRGKQDKAATLILAHGAGAPMDSDFMNDMAARLADQGVNVLRFGLTVGGGRPILRRNCWSAGGRCMPACDLMSLDVSPSVASPWAGAWPA
jgi:predicted alpha/beta-hydrolase family hydrolase